MELLEKLKGVLNLIITGIPSIQNEMCPIGRVVEF